VGDRTVAPDHAAAVAERVAAAGIGDRVRFAGRLDDKAVAAQLRESHVLAVPSRYEPFGMVYLEAMGFGCVPLATTAGGAGEFVRDGESGVLVPPDDPRAVSRALRDLDDRDRLAAMGVAARRDYEARPGWPETLDRVVEFLESEAGRRTAEVARQRGDAA
jgi:glycosyltransferase involved in cell wall biosynthesis